ncbi:hypothetical protein ACGFYV_31350 [Streptomyces sp. NPDC048297]|uniref:hypothetical protein n=1 Tax=Streptomyces sp. NPDC048297 TaxID=3365531 RepID=UPI003714458F
MAENGQGRGMPRVGVGGGGEEVLNRTLITRPQNIGLPGEADEVASCRGGIGARDRGFGLRTDTRLESLPGRAMDMDRRPRSRQRMSASVSGTGPGGLDLGTGPGIPVGVETLREVLDDAFDSGLTRQVGGDLPRTAGSRGGKDAVRLGDVLAGTDHDLGGQVGTSSSPGARGGIQPCLHGIQPRGALRHTGRITGTPVTFFVAPGSGLPASGPGMTFAPCRP